MAKCFRAENTNFIKMPTGSSYDQGTCVCSSRTMSTATTAISKVSREKKKTLQKMAYWNIMTKVVSSLQSIDSIIALEIRETVLIQCVSLYNLESKKVKWNDKIYLLQMKQSFCSHTFYVLCSTLTWLITLIRSKKIPNFERERCEFLENSFWKQFVMDALIWT